MRVFVTGGTGFVGNEVVRQLTAAGHTVRALVRPGSEEKLAPWPGVEIQRGDTNDPPSLHGAMAGCDAVIHLVGIIREFPGKGITFQRLHVEGTRHVLAEAQRQGIRRYLHMSANGARPGTSSGYFTSKWQAEELVRASGLDWTIFQPSLIHGAGDQFINMLAKLVRLLPVVPVIGDGRYRLAPVFVRDVAAAFTRALSVAASQGKTYPCCGPESYSYNQLLDLIGQALGRKRVCKIHQPLLLVRPAVSLLESFAFFPITGDQLMMLLEGSVCDHNEWADTLALAPVLLPVAMASYLKP
jgi:uncharacterized protein YbjT (DUF2867 family)